MNRLVTGLLMGAFFVSSAWAGQETTLKDDYGRSLGTASNPLVTTGAGGVAGTVSQGTAGSQAWPVGDANNASYTDWIAITPGTAFSGVRGIAAHCTASGATTITSGGSNTMVWDLGIGFQQQPFAAVNLTAVSGCTFYGLK